MADQEIEPLVRMSCTACRRGEPTVTDAEIARFHPQIPDWEVVDVAGVRRLRRVFMFDDFGRSLAFTNRVGALAEKEAHHPALLTEWGSTTVTWWTHKIRGLHRKRLHHGRQDGRAAAALSLVGRSAGTRLVGEPEVARRTVRTAGGLG